MKTPVKTLALALSLLSPLVSLSTQALPQGRELKAGAAVWNLFDDADVTCTSPTFINRWTRYVYDLPYFWLMRTKANITSQRGWQKMSTNTMTFQYALPFTRALLMNLKI